QESAAKQAQHTPQASSNTDLPVPQTVPLGVHRKEGKSSLQGICLMRSTQISHSVLGVPDAPVFPVVAVRNVALDTSFLEPITYFCIKRRILAEWVGLQLFVKKLQELRRDPRWDQQCDCAATVSARHIYPRKVPDLRTNRI